MHMTRNNVVLPPGARVLVTGANGYIGSNITNQLLKAGYRVRGTVRNPKLWLDEHFQKQYSSGAFESVVVPSFEEPGVFETLLDGVNGVVHAASDLSFNSDPSAVIPWVVKAMQNLTQAAAKTSSVKRVVLVSSSSAVSMFYPDPRGPCIDEDTWNDAAIKAAWNENTPEQERGGSIYAASKTEGEKQAWKWVKESRPPFVFNTVLPSFTVGTVLHEKIFGSTMGWTRKLLEGDRTALEIVPEQWFIDVEDVARLCLIALIDPNVQSERLFAFAEQMNWTDVIGILRQLRPQNTKTPDPPPNEIRDQSRVPPRHRAAALLQAWGAEGFAPIRSSLEKGIEGVE